LPTTTATATPNTTAINIRTATVSREDVTRDFTITDSQSCQSTQVRYSFWDFEALALRGLYANWYANQDF
jgi:hypothetical protein